MLLAVPALRALRATGASLTLAAQPRLGALLAALGVVDRAVAFDTLGLETLFTDAPLPAGSPLAREAAAATRLVSWFGARDPRFAARLGALVPGAVVAPPATTARPVWEHLLATVGGGAADRRPLAVGPAAEAAGREALRAAGWDGVSPFLLVHPGAGGPAKRWPAEGFVAVLDGVAGAVVVHAGPADAEAVDAVRQRTRRPLARLTEPSLLALAGALALARGYLGNDSGVSHLAASVGTPAVLLFTEALRAWVPWSAAACCLTVDTARLRADDAAAVASAVAGLGG